jgi:hypothetical protein
MHSPWSKSRRSNKGRKQSPYFNIQQTAIPEARFGDGCYYMLFENDIAIGNLILSQPPYRFLIS